MTHHSTTPALSGDALVRARERARIKAILGCPEAQGRERLARHLALSTSVDAYAAAAILTQSPTVGAEANAGDRHAAAAEIRAGMDAADPASASRAKTPLVQNTPEGTPTNRSAVVEAIRAGFDSSRLRHNNL